MFYKDNYQFCDKFLFDDSAQKIKFLESQHIACHNLSLLDQDKTLLYDILSSIGTS